MLNEGEKTQMVTFLIEGCASEQFIMKIQNALSEGEKVKKERDRLSDLVKLVENAAHGKLGDFSAFDKLMRIQDLIKALK